MERWAKISERSFEWVFVIGIKYNYKKHTLSESFTTILFLKKMI